MCSAGPLEPRHNESAAFLELMNPGWQESADASSLGLAKCGSAPSFADAESVRLENKRLRDEIRSMCDTIKHQSSQLSQLWADTNVYQAHQGSLGGNATLLHNIASLSRRQLDGNSVGSDRRGMQRGQSTGSLADSQLSGGGTVPAAGMASTLAGSQALRDSVVQAWPLESSRVEASMGSRMDASAGSRLDASRLEAAMDKYGVGLTGSLGHYPSRKRLPLFSPTVGPVPQLRSYANKGTMAASSTARPKEVVSQPRRHTTSTLQEQDQSASSSHSPGRPQADRWAIRRESPAELSRGTTPRSQSSPSAAQAVAQKPSKRKAGSTCGDETPTSAGKVALSLAVQNVSYALLMSDPVLLKAFQVVVKQAVAAEAGSGVGPEDVELSLSKGSVIVKATVTVPAGVAAAAVHSSLCSTTSLENALASRLTRMHGMAAVCTGIVRVNNLRVYNTATMVEDFTPTTAYSAGADNEVPRTRPSAPASPGSAAEADTRGPESRGRSRLGTGLREAPAQGAAPPPRLPPRLTVASGGGAVEPQVQARISPPPRRSGSQQPSAAATTTAGPRTTPPPRPSVKPPPVPLGAASPAASELAAMPLSPADDGFMVLHSGLGDGMDGLFIPSTLDVLRRPATEDSQRDADGGNGAVAQPQARLFARHAIPTAPARRRAAAGGGAGAREGDAVSPRDGQDATAEASSRGSPISELGPLAIPDSDDELSFGEGDTPASKKSASSSTAPRRFGARLGARLSNLASQPQKWPVPSSGAKLMKRGTPEKSESLRERPAPKPTAVRQELPKEAAKQGASKAKQPAPLPAAPKAAASQPDAPAAAAEPPLAAQPQKAEEAAAPPQQGGPPAVVPAIAQEDPAEAGKSSRSSSSGSSASEKAAAKAEAPAPAAAVPTPGPRSAASDSGSDDDSGSDSASPPPKPAAAPVAAAPVAAAAVAAGPAQAAGEGSSSSSASGSDSGSDSEAEPAAAPAAKAQAAEKDEAGGKAPKAAEPAAEKQKEGSRAPVAEPAKPSKSSASSSSSDSEDDGEGSEEEEGEQSEEESGEDSAEDQGPAKDEV